MTEVNDLAESLLTSARTVGFDAVYVTASDARELCVRVADSRVCRENVLRSFQDVYVQVTLGAREGHLHISASQKDELMSRLKQLHSQMQSQPEDKEFVPFDAPAESFRYQLATSEFMDTYGPETLYPSIEKSIRPVAQVGQRVTGYIEAKEKRQVTLANHGFCMEVYDHGMTSGFTVDHPDQVGASGSSQESGVLLNRDHVGGLVTKTVEDARAIAQVNRNPSTVSAGDYTVVLHPRAVADIAGTAIMYRMFDRRKIDEGRTYLSKAKDGLKFPRGMSFVEAPNMTTSYGTFEGVPFNEYFHRCDPLALIGEGTLQGFHTDPFWAKTHGIEQTFQPYFAPPYRLSCGDGDGFAGGVHQSLEDLIASTERGIYVANTWYLRLVSEMDGTITGMTRDGVFEIRDGKIIKPIHNLRWHENPFRVLAEADAGTTDQHLLGLSRWAGRSRGGLMACPALRVPRFHFSSETKF